VVEEVSPFYAIFFVVYVSFVVFGMVRVISALFVRETMQQASRDHELIVLMRQKKTSAFKQDLSDLFQAADTSGDGTLSIEEMEDLVSQPKVQTWLAESGIDASDACLLFELLDDGDGAITHQEFVEGITKIKGEARAQDLVPVLLNSQRILANCKHMRSTCERFEASMVTTAASRHAVPLKYPPLVPSLHPLSRTDDAVSLKCPSQVPSLLPPLSSTEGTLPTRSM
jgi:hypothetical protein